MSLKHMIYGVPNSSCIKFEKGDHKELMAKNGFYAELYNSQFEL